MSGHIESCRAKAPAAAGQKLEKRLPLAVEGADLPEFWMHLEVPALATLADLDGFLRDAWLECCGHMSAFEIRGKQYMLEGAPREEDEESMDIALSTVLKPGMKFGYQYDFGSTTALTLKVIAEHDAPGAGKRDDPVRILARNDPPLIPCGECGKPAVLICANCAYEEAGWLCKACAKKHAKECEGEEMMLPVVNSPRVGVCAYTGPEKRTR